MTTRRDWSLVEHRRAEGCRVARDCSGPIQLAHTIGRSWDEARPGKPNVLVVHPQAVIPLCQEHHGRYDSHLLDILPYLTLKEQAYAASKLGLVRALKRVGGVEPPSEEVPK